MKKLPLILGIKDDIPPAIRQWASDPQSREGLLRESCAVCVVEVAQNPNLPPSLAQQIEQSLHSLEARKVVLVCRALLGNEGLPLLALEDPAWYQLFQNKVLSQLHHARFDAALRTLTIPPWTYLDRRRLAGLIASTVSHRLASHDLFGFRHLILRYTQGELPTLDPRAKEWIKRLRFRPENHVQAEAKAALSRCTRQGPFRSADVEYVRQGANGSTLYAYPKQPPPGFTLLPFFDLVAGLAEAAVAQEWPPLLDRPSAMQQVPLF